MKSSLLSEKKKLERDINQRAKLPTLKEVIEKDYLAHLYKPGIHKKLRHPMYFTSYAHQKF